MAEFRIPPSQAGYDPHMVPRCREKGVINPEASHEDWTYRRCTREDCHRGRHAATRNGRTVRW